MHYRLYNLWLSNARGRTVRCNLCLVPPDLFCLGSVPEHGSLCLTEAFRKALLDRAKGEAVVTTPSALVLHVELCDFRTSACGCLNKLAVCRLTTQPVMMDCLACPVFEDPKA
jgi:hypothetical protein